MKKNKEELTEIINEVKRQAEAVFAEKLNSVILFGSYARGDFDEESDIDILICADIQPEEVTSFLLELIDKIYIFELDNDCVISPCVVPTSVFYKYKAVLPFYRNIDKEGVRIGD